jgi:predicted permease
VQMLWQDLRYGLRMLRKSPAFTIVAVLTLALGIGANTAIFSVVEGVLLAPLQYFHPDRLVMVWENNPRFPRTWVSYPNFRDWQGSARSFQQMAAFREQGVDLTGPGTPEHLNGKEVSSGFFSTLGTELALGREFSPEEDRQGGTPVAVISNRLWRNRFDGSPEALGRTLTLEGVDCTIVGVTPLGFRLPEDDADVYTPLGRSDPLILNDRAGHDGIYSLARLATGVTLAQAQAEISTIQNGLDQLYPDANRDLGIYIEPLKQFVVGDAGKMLLLLLGAVGFVLLIACANVANLLLARSAARAREFGVRSALGANRTRLVRQLLTESVLLSLLGAGLGLLIAILGVKSVLSAVSENLPRSENIGVNAPVLFFTLGASIAVGILFGLVPALKVWNSDPQLCLKEGGRGSSGARHRAQSGLVIVQMALTLVLLVGAGLLFRTIQHLWDVNPGFDTQNVITFKVGISHSQTNTPSGTRIAYQQLIERIRQIPGVEAADFTSSVPLTGGWTMPFWIGSRKPASLQGAPRLVMFLTGPDYLRTMGIPLLRGRFFTPEDTTKSPCVMVIDSLFAGTYFPDSDPLTQTLSAGFSPVGPCRIVGVVGHVRHWSLQDPSTYTQIQAYLPLYQDPDKWVPLNYPSAKIVVRSPLDAATVMPSIRKAVYAGGSDQPVYEVHAMREIVSESMSSQRFPMNLLGTFAGLALLLASVGIYGVISYSVSQRVHEIGIRMALGADKRDVFRMVVGQGITLALVGLAIGVVAALILTRLLSRFSLLLYGIGASDPLTFTTVSVMLISVAVLACYIPARRAMKVDPMVALRYE